MTGALWIWLAAVLGIWMGIIIERCFAGNRCAARECYGRAAGEWNGVTLCREHWLRLFGAERSA